MKKSIIIVVCAVVVAAAMFAASIIFFFAAIQKNNEADEKLRQLNAATADEAAETVDPSGSTDASVEAATLETSTLMTLAGDSAPAEVNAPAELEEFLALNSITAQELSDRGCQQLVTVRSSGSTAQIDFYQFAYNEWTKNDALSCSGFVGANGVTTDMHEGGYATPKGVFTIGDAFYIYQKPATGLNTFEITPDTYWVDDPDSQFYNKRVEGASNKDWNSAEHMIDYTTAYEYGFVIDYNTEAKYNAGSAIFFHVSYSSTAGCVGIEKSMLLNYLAALGADSNPYIAIA